MEKIFYLAQIFGAINALSVTIIVLSLLALLFFAVWYFSDGLYEPSVYNEDDANACKKWMKKSVILAVVGILAATFTPSKQTYLFMVGGHALEEIANNEKVQERASHTIDLLDQYLENKAKDSSKE